MAKNDAGFLRHFHTTKNRDGRFGTAPGLDVTITDQGYRERDTVALAIYNVLRRRVEPDTIATASRVDVFTSPGRSYDSGRALAHKLGALGVRVAVDADPLLNGYDLGPLAGKTLAEMRALDPDTARRVEAYKQGFGGPLTAGQTSENHYRQVQRGVESHVFSDRHTDLILFIGNSSTVGVIDDLVRRGTVLAQTGRLLPPEYRQADLERGEVRFFNALDHIWSLSPAQFIEGEMTLDSQPF